MASIDQQIDQLVQPLSSALSNFIFYKIPILGNDFPIIVLWLVSAATFFTFYYGFINIRAFKSALKLILVNQTQKERMVRLLIFRPLSTAISGTVGIGNIGGVAVAISIGGPGGSILVVFSGFSRHVNKIC